MSLLKNLLESTSKTRSRTAKVNGSIDGLITTMTLQKQAKDLAARQAAMAPAAQPTVAASAPTSQHRPGDGHDHAGGKGLAPDFQDAMSRMIKDSGGKIKIGSGYRSIAEQTKIYNLWKAGKHPAPLVAKPGSSNHNYGLAADLQFSDGAARKWAHANAAKYGLRFPMGNEPWHVEPADARARRKAQSGGR